MTRRLSRWFVACGVLGISCTVAAGQTRPTDTVLQIDQPTVERAPAHISFVDGAAALYRDGASESAPSNMPVLAGDRIKTDTGRVEVMFDDGSTLHLDVQTTVDFESDSLVRLLDGRVRLSVAGPNRAVSYRIDTPAASVEIAQPGEYRVAILHNGRGDESELAVLRGAADLVNDAGRTPLRAGQRAFSTAQAAPSYAYAYNSATWDTFDRWSEARRSERVSVSRQYLPDPVRPYGAAFDNYGAWQYDTSYGYVWYPRVSVGWRPYYNGYWSALRPYGWTWVGGDPWAWPTHHYGRWGFSANAWFWIPGASWGAAWVSWVYAPSYVSWCALGWNNRPIVPVGYGYAHYGDPWRAWTVVPHQHFGSRGANVRAVAVRPAGPRAGEFVSSPRGPDVRAYAVPRSGTPIQSVGPSGVGARADRGLRSPSAPSTSTVYTNRQPFESRTPANQQRVMVGSAAPRGAVQPQAGAVPSPRDGTAVAGSTLRTAPSLDARQAAPGNSAYSARTARPSAAGPSTSFSTPMQATARGDASPRTGPSRLPVPSAGMPYTSSTPSRSIDSPTPSIYGDRTAPNSRTSFGVGAPGSTMMNTPRPTASFPPPQAMERRGPPPDRTSSSPPPSAGPSPRSDGGNGGRSRPSGQPAQGGAAARPRGR